VGEISPETARLSAESLLSGVARETLKILSDEPTLNLRDAKARARGEMRGPRGQRRATWKQFLDDHYAAWVTEHRKTGAETVARLRSRFGEFDDVRLSEMSQFAIERWRSTRLKAGVKPATVNRDFAALRAALSKAVEWRALKAHPMAAVKVSRVDTTGHVRYLRAWRLKAKGPRFVRFGRAVRYLESDIAQYMDACAVVPRLNRGASTR
jgi:hypothetical protein